MSMEPEKDLYAFDNEPKRSSCQPSAASAGYAQAEIPLESLVTLKPCPFCGGKANVDVQSHYATITAKHIGDCLMDGEEFGRIKPTHRAMDWMTEAWNRRA